MKYYEYRKEELTEDSLTYELNRLGREGWRLVSTLKTEKTDWHTFHTVILEKEQYDL